MDIKKGLALRHISRGSTYIVIHVGQLSLPADMLKDETVLVADQGSELVQIFEATAGDPIGVQNDGDGRSDEMWVLYRSMSPSEDTEIPELWLRPLKEFTGRFTEVF